jgi:hypothetical protein
MHTRSSPDQYNTSEDGQGGGSDTLHCQWSSEEEALLIDYVVENKDQMGDGTSFWSAAAEQIKPHSKKGATKTAAKCKTKWNRVGLKDS